LLVRPKSLPTRDLSIDPIQTARPQSRSGPASRTGAPIIATPLRVAKPSFRLLGGFHRLHRHIRQAAAASDSDLDVRDTEDDDFNDDSVGPDEDSRRGSYRRNTQGRASGTQRCTNDGLCIHSSPFRNERRLTSRVHRTQ
jgi:hypothetical protein